MGRVRIVVHDGEAAKLARFSVSDFDLVAASEAALKTGNPIADLIEQLYPASAYAHFGITSNDPWDVAHVLQLKTAVKFVVANVRVAVERLTLLVESHATTLMVARTQGQAGAPTTLGFKFATLLDELLRIAERLVRTMEEAAVISVAGIVGTGSSFAVIGASPDEVESEMAGLMGLRVGRAPWFTARDRFVALTAALAQLCTFAGKVGHEVYNLQRTGIEEVTEGGACGSSATPQKTNPWISQRMHGLAVLEILVHRRGRRGLGRGRARGRNCIRGVVRSDRPLPDQWPARWRLAELVGHLEVHAEVMLANLQRDPTVYSESISMLLSRAVGKARGYALVKAAIARYRAGQPYPKAMEEAFRQAGLHAPEGSARLPGALGWAVTRAQGIAAAAREWLSADARPATSGG